MRKSRLGYLLRVCPPKQPMTTSAQLSDLWAEITELMEQCRWDEAHDLILSIAVGPFSEADRHFAEVMAESVVRCRDGLHADTEKLKAITANPNHKARGFAGLMLAAPLAFPPAPEDEMRALRLAVNADATGHHALIALKRMIVLAGTARDEGLVQRLRTELRERLDRYRALGGDRALIALPYEADLAEEEGHFDRALEHLQALMRSSPSSFDGDDPGSVRLRVQLKRLQAKVDKWG